MYILRELWQGIIYGALTLLLQNRVTSESTIQFGAAACIRKDMKLIQYFRWFLLTLEALFTLRNRRLIGTPNGLLQNCTQHFHLGNDYLHHVYHQKYTTHSASTLPGSYPGDRTCFRSA
jgi:hypothetical protein